VSDAIEFEAIPPSHEGAAKLLEELAAERSGKGGGPPVDVASNYFCFASASLLFGGSSDQLSGWITYMNNMKIRFISTKFTTRMLSFGGAGGATVFTYPPEVLEAKTGRFIVSGGKELAALRIYFDADDKWVFSTPLPLLGEGGAGHLAEGEVIFRRG
jgi:hypothetical protein